MINSLAVGLSRLSCGALSVLSGSTKSAHEATKRRKTIHKEGERGDGKPRAGVKESGAAGKESDPLKETACTRTVIKKRRKNKNKHVID
jgi:hypothetical protein